MMSQSTTKNIGKIQKVAGPLVVAVGLPEAKMYEVAKVGEKKLLGEVIRIEKDLVFIQVYEETSGVGPGEPVELTGDSLAVELGPGLLSSIYDGVQRPLSELQKKSGPFIERGVEAQALSREKRWHFKPQKKQGDKVEPGDVLGEVQETEILAHKIMVPPFLEPGEIIEIAPEGDYTIKETIAKIKTVKGEQEITMSHKWPIRQPRPIKEKLLPQKALITGQRVIDTFFPIARGGAGSVPGPFGSGKCVKGDTMVMKGDGRIVTMKEIFQEGVNKGKLIKKDETEEIYDIKGLSNLSVISMEKQGFSSQEPITAYKGMTDSTVKIKTRTGREVEVTPIHKMYIMEDGEIKQRMAQDIKEGDYLVAPRKINLDLNDQVLDYKNILKNASQFFSADQEVNKKAKVYLRKLLENNELAQRFKQYLKKDRKIPLSLLFLLEEKCGLELRPKRICSYHGKTITLPQKTSPQLAEFLGYIMADGNLNESSYSIRFYNDSQDLVERFSELSQALFGVRPYVRPHPKSPGSFVSQIDCKALFDILVGLGVPCRKKASNAVIPECVLMSSDKTLGRFIWAYINCDGTIDSNQKASRLSITSKSKKIIKQFAFAFLRFGIVGSVIERKKDGTNRITVNGSRQLKILLKYANEIGKIKLLRQSTERKEWPFFDSFPVPSYVKRFLQSSKMLSRVKEEKGIHIERYVYSDKYNITTSMFRKVVDAFSSLSKIPAKIKEFMELTENVFFDKVVAIQEVNSPSLVYDVEVPSGHNFVGGHGGLVLSNTVIQQQICRWSDADVIVYCATGERGNEVAELLKELPKLKDPKSGKPLMERTVIIANTSNMPVAAREASIYTAITIAEYYRDMGYSVVVLADSTSRWAEALREISGRLEEMPGDEGYPAYLGSRTAAFYERAGLVRCYGNDQREGSLTVIGAVSPPGGDLSEPVTQNTLRVTKVFWALDSSLAYRRHFPAINWLDSYSLYLDNLKEFFEREGGEGFNEIRQRAMEILQKENNLQEIVRLVGVEALSEEDQFTLEIARMIREDFLQQNAYDRVDAYTPLKKQYRMLKKIMDLERRGREEIKKGRKASEVLTDQIKEEISKLKFLTE